MLRRFFVLFSLGLMVLLAGCGPVRVPLLLPTQGQIPALDATCPVPTGDLQQLAVDREGYCLLYPAGYIVEQPADGITVLVMDGLLDAAHAHINVEDALGRTAEEVATALVDEFNPLGFELEISQVNVANETGFMVDNVPGQDLNRQLFVVHNGRLYSFLFAPADVERAEVQAQMEDLYTTVIDSFTFIAPTAPTGLPRP
ncbi:MAG: hypothetical protein KF893_08410 [Caldilineaceae bacterium]|nr:hypothetical protein [Caldilineaceae bacterium]